MQNNACLQLPSTPRLQLRSRPLRIIQKTEVWHDLSMDATDVMTIRHCASSPGAVRMRDLKPGRCARGRYHLILGVMTTATTEVRASRTVVVRVRLRLCGIIVLHMTPRIHDELMTGKLCVRNRHILEVG